MRDEELHFVREGDRHPLCPGKANAKHPERYVLGKAHADRAKQFKPFAALRGYEELVARAIADAAESHDFFEPEEPC